MAVKMPNKNNKNGAKQIARFGLFWAIVIFLGLIIYASLMPGAGLKDVALTDVVRRANAGEVAKLEIQGNELKVTPKGQDAPTERSTKESGTIYEQGLKTDAKVEVSVLPPSTTGEVMWNLAIMIIPVVVIVAFFMFMMRQAQGQNNQAMGFGKSKARLYGQDKEKVVFADVAGNDNAKQDLHEVVDFLKHPKKYKGKKRGRKPQRLNKRFRPTMLANGETVIELLTRSKYLLSVSGEKWTDRQKTRAKILFGMFPKIKEAYTLICSLRSVFSNKSIDRGTAKVQLHEWYQKVSACTLREVKAARDAIKYKEEEVLNYFINRSTNAHAESLNSKLKGFRAQLRGVQDLPFFMFRASMIFG